MFKFPVDYPCDGRRPDRNFRRHGVFIPCMKSALAAFIAVTLLAPGLLAQTQQDAAGDPTSKTFRITIDTKIHTPVNRTAGFADLKVDDKVGIAYAETNGTLTAENIRVLSKTISNRSSKAQKGESDKTRKGQGLLHARGTITAVNKTNATITVAVQTPHKRS
jgi:hypothetical protein